MSYGLQPTGGLGLSVPTSSALGLDATDTDSGSIYSLDNLTPTYAWYTDQREAAKMDAFVPRIEGDTRPWWERSVEYGITRAIDNKYGPGEVNKTDMPPTFAGQNGKTYSQVPPSVFKGYSDPGAGSILPLLLGAAAIFMLA